MAEGSGASLDVDVGELAGELTGVGAAADVVGAVAAVLTKTVSNIYHIIKCYGAQQAGGIEGLPLHWLMGGVWTLQAPGSDIARV